MFASQLKMTYDYHRRRDSVLPQSISVLQTDHLITFSFLFLIENKFFINYILITVSPTPTSLSVELSYFGALKMNEMLYN